MTLNITLDEELASRLQANASARRISAEEFARALLGDALQELEEEHNWGAQNRRRLNLIRKAHRGHLTSDEQRELHELQQAADQRMEERDSQLLDTLEDLRAVATRVEKKNK